MKDIVLICEDIFGLDIYSLLAETNRWYEQRGKERPYNILGYIIIICLSAYCFKVHYNILSF